MTTIKHYIDLAIDYAAFMVLAVMYLLANALNLMDINGE
jgi:hypothetical protein